MNRLDLSCHDTIKESIRKIALHNLVNRETGTVRNMDKITGYVAKIHTEGELAGTVDVQEFTNTSIIQSGDVKAGYHTGVYLSAIQNNLAGMIIIPKLYSEVTIETDPATFTEYVTMYSHVDCIRMDAHDLATIGVSERDEYDPDDPNSPDIDELELTGKSSQTSYTKDSATTIVQDKGNEEKAAVTTTPQQFSVDIGDGVAKQTINKEAATTQIDKTKLTITKDNASVVSGSSEVVVEDGKVYVGSTSNTDDAVLGSELASLLMDMLDAIAQIKTTTQLGPQPVLNIAQFIAIKTKINAFKNAHSGFLTNKVQIQK